MKIGHHISCVFQRMERGIGYSLAAGYKVERRDGLDSGDARPLLYGHGRQRIMVVGMRSKN